jgi:diphosphomevalonate decarboxylase
MFELRQKNIKQKLSAVRMALKEKEFTRLGTIIEEEALEFHSLLFTMKPPYIALKPESLKIMLVVQQLRSEGIECYFTINTGHNVHVLTTEKHLAVVRKKMVDLKEVQQVFQAKVVGDPLQLDQHLF